MSYEPTTWKSGDVVTSAKLNKIEKGIEDAGSGGCGGALIVHDVEGTLDKTWQEIHDAAPLVWGEAECGFKPLGAVFEDEGDYCAIFIEPQPNGSIINTYIATSADGYPVFQGADGPVVP